MWLYHNHLSYLNRKSFIRKGLSCSISMPNLRLIQKYLWKLDMGFLYVHDTFHFLYFTVSVNSLYTEWLLCTHDTQVLVQYTHTWFRSGRFPYRHEIFTNFSVTKLYCHVKRSLATIISHICTGEGQRYCSSTDSIDVGIHYHACTTLICTEYKMPTFIIRGTVSMHTIASV